MTATRQTRRFVVRIPLRIRLLDSPSLPEREVESANISSRGVYFASNFPFQVGERVEVLLTMPEEIIGQPVRDWHCHGRIVRTQHEEEPAAPIGVGVEFLYYEVLRKPNPSSSNYFLHGREA